MVGGEIEVPDTGEEGRRGIGDVVDLVRKRVGRCHCAWLESGVSR